MARKQRILIVEDDPSSLMLATVALDVALTANNMPLHERAARAAGCEGFIAKPVSPAVLTAQVRAYLRRRAG